MKLKLGKMVEYIPSLSFAEIERLCQMEMHKFTRDTLLPCRSEFQIRDRILTINIIPITGCIACLV